MRAGSTDDRDVPNALRAVPGTSQGVEKHLAAGCVADLTLERAHLSFESRLAPVQEPGREPPSAAPLAESPEI